MIFFWNFLLRIGQERNGTITFYFLFFPSFSNLLWLEMNPQWYFLIFLYFFASSLKFSITNRVGMERNDNLYFFTFSALSNLFLHEMKPKWYCLIFLIFLLFFWNFVLRVVQERNGTKIYIFFFFAAFSNLFWLEMNP